MALTFLLPPSLGKAKTEARAELLLQAMQSALGEAADILVPADYRELETLALSGRAQVFWGPASVCARVEPSARAIFKVVRNGYAVYRSALIARRGEDLTLGRIAGLRAAWVDALSIGGYLLAVDLLRRRGLDPDRVLRAQTFTGSHPAAATAVLIGTADLAAVTTTGADDASVAQSLELYVGPAATRLHALAVTEEAPTDGIVVTSQLSVAESQRVIDKLFARDGKDARAASLLRSAMDAEGFVRARPNEYQPLLRLFRAGGSTPSSGPPPLRR